MLRASLDEADRGAGLVVMLAGEAGIGKTRTCEELSLIADARGFRVVRGRAYEAEGTPPFWPWIQALREHVAEGLSKDIEALMGLRREASSRYDPETARFRLFDRIARLLRDTTAKEPLLVVLEDLHWADKASLLLLESPRADERCDHRTVSRHGSIARSYGPFARSVESSDTLFRRSPALLPKRALSLRACVDMLRLRPGTSGTRSAWGPPESRGPPRRGTRHRGNSRHATSCPPCGVLS